MATMQEKMNVQDLILNLEAAGFEKDQIDCLDYLVYQIQKGRVTP